jgi:hypothetical protein
VGGGKLDVARVAKRVQYAVGLKKTVRTAPSRHPNRGGRVEPPENFKRGANI